MTRPLEDSEIISLYFRRDQQAIAQTESKFGGLCRKIAKNILGTKEDADECLNDALYQLWESIPPAKPKNLGAYLTVCVRNLACNRREASHAAKRGGGQLSAAYEELADCLSAPDDTESAYDLRALTDALNRFLADLPAETRTMFVLRYWGALSVSEVASQTACSQSKVKMTLMRTRTKLKAFLEKEGLV